MKRFFKLIGLVVMLAIGATISYGVRYAVKSRMNSNTTSTAPKIDPKLQEELDRTHKELNEIINAPRFEELPIQMNQKQKDDVSKRLTSQMIELTGVGKKPTQQEFPKRPEFQEEWLPGRNVTLQNLASYGKANPSESTQK